MSYALDNATITIEDYDYALDPDYPDFQVPYDAIVTFSVDYTYDKGTLPSWDYPGDPESVEWYNLRVHRVELWHNGVKDCIFFETDGPLVDDITEWIDSNMDNLYSRIEEMCKSAHYQAEETAREAYWDSKA